MVKTSKKKLLIVDDSSIIVERLLDALKDHETVKDIFTATNYQEALDLVMENKPDIIILDIQLTGKNGIDLLKMIIKEHATAKVIMFTNLADENYFKLCKELGASYCLDKSKDFEQIPGILKNL